MSSKCSILCVILAFICLLLTAWAQDSQTSGGGAGGEQRVKLGVFMESLCPDSRRFFNRQLVPTYREIGSIMTLQLVPFGHARTLGQGKMVCQHGPRECEGNRRMACVQSKSNNESRVVETIGCLFEASDSVQGCIEKNLPGVSYQDIENCTKSDESYQMMVAAEKQTGRLDYVPHLTVDGEWSDEIQNGAEHELKKFVCQKYKGQKPVDACKSTPTSSDAPSEPAF